MRGPRRRARGGPVGEGRFPGHGRRRAAGRPGHRDRAQPDAADGARRRLARGDRCRQARLLGEAVRDDARGRGGDPRGWRRGGRGRRGRARHVPRRRAADGARAHRRGRDRRADRGECRGHAPGTRALAPRTRTSSTARAAARCWTSVRTTSRRWSACSARSRPCRPRRAAPARERRISSGARAGETVRRPGPDPRRRGLPVRLRGDRRVHGVVRRRGQRVAAHRDPRHGRLAEPRRPEPFRRGRPAAALSATTTGWTSRSGSTGASGAGSASRT